jgi:hypothetical protein
VANSVEVHATHCTAEDHVEQIKALANLLSQDRMVSKASLDDWGRYSNFSLCIAPNSPDRFTTNRLKGLVGRLMAKEGIKAKVRGVIVPERKYEQVYDYRAEKWIKKPSGYVRAYWMFDIDYQDFNAATNQFSAP